ncbi:MAG: hypothetical protein ABL949_12075, partial [Fimbriimonadaceae bacterium]
TMTDPKVGIALTIVITAKAAHGTATDHKAAATKATVLTTTSADRGAMIVRREKVRDSAAAEDPLTETINLKAARGTAIDPKTAEIVRTTEIIEKADHGAMIVLKVAATRVIARTIARVDLGTTTAPPARLDRIRNLAG